MTVETLDRPTQISMGRDRLLIWAALGIFLVALALRFWHLLTLPYPIFDEVYFPKFAESYLDGVAPWEGHPPLGKYLIMLGILVGGRNPLGYRLASAIAGALIPVLLMGLAYRLTGRWLVALLAGVLILMDGLFLVESRLSLINVFLVAFGLAAQILLLAGLERQGQTRTWMLCGTGVLLGASFSVKWNGAGFALMIFLLATLVWAIALLAPQHLKQLGVLAEITQLRWWQLLLCFGIIPAGFYGLQWVPHLLESAPFIEENPPQAWGAIGTALGQSFLAVHQHILWWHSGTEVVGQAAQAAHPYCSRWFTWPLLARPVSYNFENRDGIFIDVHALGNPALWWAAALAIPALLVWGRRQFGVATVYLTVGYVANYLPWMIVKRCQFLYHYMSAVTFSFLALALLLSWMLQRDRWRYLAWSILLAGGFCLVYFLPIWLGLPLTPSEFYQRMWFNGQLPGFNWI